MLHYHIRWGTGELDWECHATRDEAEKSAQKLAYPDEVYAIQEVRDGKCPVCNASPLQKRA